MTTPAYPDIQAPRRSGARKPVTLHRLREMHAAGEKIAVLTCYDATFAQALEASGVDCLLIGDSLGMVLQGRSSTLPVTLDEMAYHTASVARGAGACWVIADLPFGAYHEGPEQAMASAAALMRAGAQMIKLEGAGWTTPIVRFLVERGVPICAHLGLTPQSVHALGGWRVQGREAEAATEMRRQAEELVEAGAAMLVLELVPAALAREIAEALPIPVIGIGAGAGCTGQVLVMHDMLGVTRGKPPRFVRNFMDGAASVEDAVSRYVAEVKAGTYPDERIHAF